jgi:hypothetical protein
MKRGRFIVGATVVVGGVRTVRAPTILEILPTASCPIPT